MSLAVNTVHNIDAIELMKQLPNSSVDLIVTDPPYNIGDDNKRTKVKDTIMSNKEAWGSWDSFNPFDYDLLICKLISESYRVLKEGGGVLYV